MADLAQDLGISPRAIHVWRRPGVSAGARAGFELSWVGRAATSHVTVQDLETEVALGRWA
jgi:hypothetical protein